MTLTDAETRPRPGQPGACARSAVDRLQPARRPDQHRHGRGARRRQLVGLRARTHDRPGRTRARRWPAAPAPLSVPAATLDAPPTGAIVDPFGPTIVAWGETIYPVVVAADDFGVKSVDADRERRCRSRPSATRRTSSTYTPAYDAHRRASSPWRRRSPTPRGQTSVVSTEVDVPAITTSTTGTVAGTVPATLALTVGARRRVRRLHPRSREGLHRHHDRHRDSPPPATPR